MLFMIIFLEDSDKNLQKQNFYELCTVTQSQVTINFSCYIPGIFQSKSLQFSYLFRVIGEENESFYDNRI